MKFSSGLVLKSVFLFAAIVFFSPSLLVYAMFAAPVPELCPPPWWMWAIFGGLLFPWIPFLLFRRKVIVTFDDGIDDKPYQQKYTRGDKINIPDAFNRPGYYIEGWYRSKSYEKEKKWDFESKIKTSMTLHAKWELDGSRAEPLKE